MMTKRKVYKPKEEPKREMDKNLIDVEIATALAFLPDLKLFLSQQEPVRVEKEPVRRAKE